MRTFGKILCLATVGISIAGCGIVEALKQQNGDASSTVSTADASEAPAIEPTATEPEIGAGEPTASADPAQATAENIEVADDQDNSLGGNAEDQGSSEGDQTAEVPPAETPPPPPASKPKIARALPEPFDPELYLGLDQAAVRQRLGAPETEGGKGQATVWGYSDRHCNFTISFYLDLNTDQQRSLTYDLQLEETRQNSVNLCLSERRLKAADASS